MKHNVLFNLYLIYFCVKTGKFVIFRSLDCFNASSLLLRLTEGNWDIVSVGHWPINLLKNLLLPLISK